MLYLIRQRPLPLASKKKIVYIYIYIIYIHMSNLVLGNLDGKMQEPVDSFVQFL